MLTESLDLIRQLTLASLSKIPDDDEVEEAEDEADTTDDEVEEKDEEAEPDDHDDPDEETEEDEVEEAEEEPAKEDMFSRSYVEGLRKENSKRRKTAGTYKQTIKDLEAEVATTKREQRNKAEAKKKTDAADSRLAVELEQARVDLQKVTDERDRFRIVQEETGRVMIVNSIAADLGFIDKRDALLNINDQIDELVDDNGDLDPDTVRNVLMEVLDRKPYLAAQTASQETEQEAEKKRKSRAEAARTDNPASDANLKAPNVQTGQSQSEREINDKIIALNRKGLGGEALRLKIDKIWLPRLQKEAKYARMS